MDAAFAEPLVGEVEEVKGSRLLSFAGVAPASFRVYPLEVHIAEKLHAYTMPRNRPNTRVKDLPDLALLASARGIDAEKLRSAIAGIFGHRATHPIPSSTPQPGGALPRAREVRFTELWPPDEYVDPMDLPDSQQGALASPWPDPEATLITKERLTAVLRGNADDEPASLVIACLFEGLTVPEMRRRLSISERRLETTKVRIRRRARRIEAGEPGS